jgi:hypothetical protein
MMISKTQWKNKSRLRLAESNQSVGLAGLLKFFHVAAECLTLLTDFAEGMYDPLTELAKVFVERKRSSDAEPLHDREAGAIRKTESLVRILTEDGPSPFFVSGSDPNDRCRGLPSKRSPNCKAGSYPSRMRRRVIVS